jgi:hypothetical protein
MNVNTSKPRSRAKHHVPSTKCTSKVKVLAHADARNVAGTRGGQWKLITKAELKLITRLASEGKRERHIAHELGMTQPTFIARKRDQPGVQEALDKGVEYFHNVVLNDLLRQSRRGNVAATIFALKSRHGYREADASSGDVRPQVIINLPGAADAAQYVGRVIEGEVAAPLSLPSAEVEVPAAPVIATKRGVRRG